MTEKDLAERVEQATNELAESKEAGDETSQLVFVNAASIDMAFHISSTVELVTAQHLTITNLPHLKSPLIGVVRRRGRLIPVIDGGLLIGGMPASRGSHGRLVVCKGPEGELGILVDEVTSVTTVKNCDFREMASSQWSSAGEFISAVVEFSSVDHVVIDIALLWNNLRSRVPLREAHSWNRA